MKDQGELISFKIDRWTPETIPMARLAEYMKLAADLYGQDASVHFKGLRKGSAVLEVAIETEAYPKVHARLELVKTGAAPDDLRKTYEKIDTLLREDNAVGTITRKGSTAKIIEFPGRKIQPPAPVTITQPSSVDGVVVKIGGYDETIPMVLQDAEGAVYHCTIKGRAHAREMAKFLFGAPIRVQGTGRWTRDPHGDWRLENLTVSEHEELDADTLPEVVAKLREAASKGNWSQESIERWKRDRKG